MIDRTSFRLRQSANYLLQLRNGNETGLEHFYKIHYPRLAWWALKRVKDDIAASSITHEAFLKLWLLREKMENNEQIILFLQKQIHQGCNDFYLKTSLRFHRGMMKLDDTENYQEFIGGYDPEYVVEEIDTVYQQELDKERKQQWEAVETVMPSLSKEQQLFIKLCLQYSFSYDRIAWYLGGISDYEVARKIEKTIEILKNVIVNAKKLDVTAKTKSFSFEGGISEEQSQILNMRYEMKFSFEEIANELGLSRAHIQRTFVQAHSVMKKASRENLNRPF